MPKRSGSSARGGRAAASVRRTTRKIDFSDIPGLVAGAVEGDAPGGSAAARETNRAS